MERLVHWKELFESDKTQRYCILEERLNISGEEINIVNSDILLGAILIYQKALEITGKKSSALFEISTQTLAAIVDEEWNKSSSATRRVSKELHKMFSPGRKDKLPLIHYLRKETFETVNEKELIPNVLKLGIDKQIDFSVHDIKRGIRIPNNLDALSFFVLGAYYAIGYPIHRNNQFYLSVNERNLEFVRSILNKAVLDMFNITLDINSGEKTKKSGFNKKEYTFVEHACSISSKAHYQFIDKQFNSFRKIGEDTYILPERLFQKDSSCDIDEKYYHFFMGIINSRGNIQNENGSKILLIMNNNYSYLDNIRNIANQNGLDPSLKPKNSYNILRFSKRDLEKMTTMENLRLSEEKPHIFSNSRGIFVNPYQLSQLSTF